MKHGTGSPEKKASARGNPVEQAIRKRRQRLSQISDIKSFLSRLLVMIIMIYIMFWVIFGLKPMAKLLYSCGAGVEPKYMGLGPSKAIPKCLAGAGISFEDVDYWEINEAFAAQFLGVEKRLAEEYGWKLDPANVNRNGSGISLGHPIGCTGLRIIVSMLYEMQRTGEKIGCASLCVGSGPAMASVWTRNV
jgi:acetyl-CoA acetyltransferase